MMNRLLTDVFHDKPVSLSIKPWLNNWWKIIFKVAWHAPIVLINGKMFSQGGIPAARDLILKVAEILDDDDLRKRSEWFIKKQHKDEIKTSIQVYSSPTCPHCRDLKHFLDQHNISYDVRNVVEDISALNELKALTGMMSIPVTVVDGKPIVGFSVQNLSEIFNIVPQEDINKSMSIDSEISMDIDLTSPMEAAKKVLASNNIGKSTRASSHLYPHQWNWDAGFVARGYLHYAPEMAYEELSSLFRGQWENGFLPHIIFNSDYLDHFPGPNYWKGERSKVIPKQIYTSGISQPPVHASMIVSAMELDQNANRVKSFFKEIYPKLKRLHDYYFEFRDPDNENLVLLVHPWESGLDNSPLWDTPLSNITQSSEWAAQMAQIADKLAAKSKRPRRPYIEKYSYLVQQLFKKNYNWNDISRSHPIRIQDVLFNSILCQAEKDLAIIAQEIGVDHLLHVTRAEKLAHSLNEKLWNEDEGLYFSYDMVEGKHIKKDTVFSYVPLYAGICTEDRARKLIDNLKTHCYCVGDKSCIGIPSYDMCQADFNGEFYWRGPVWININWYLIQGLRRYGENELASWLEASLLKLISEKGFYEYYSPEDGRGLGADGFSWTAALFIDMASNHV